MSFKVTGMVLDCDELSDRSEFCVMFVMSSWSDDHGRCFPSLPTLARKSRLSRRSLIYTLKELRKKGFVDWKENAGGRSRSNRYTLNLQRLAEGVGKPVKTRRQRPGKGATVAPFEEAGKGATDAPFTNGKGAIPAHVKGAKLLHSQGQVINTTTNPTDIPQRSALEEEDTFARDRAHEDPPPATDPTQTPDVDVDDWGWLGATDQVYLPTIREKHDLYRPADGRELLIHTWRRRADVPDAALVELINTHPWPVVVAGIVIAADDNRPTLKFLSGILKRLRHEHEAYLSGIVTEQPFTRRTTHGKKPGNVTLYTEDDAARIYRAALAGALAQEA